MPGTVVGSAATIPNFNVGFRFDSAAFDLLSTLEKRAAVYEARARIMGYFTGSTGSDPGGADEVFPIPDLKGQAIQMSTSFSRGFSSAADQFTVAVTFVPDPSQTKGLNTNLVSARIETVVSLVLDEITTIEADLTLPISATIEWL